MPRNTSTVVVTIAVLLFASIGIAQEHPSAMAFVSVGLPDHPKTGQLTLYLPTLVGTNTLEPGDYKVQLVRGESGASVQFLEQLWGAEGETGQGFSRWKAVATVPCTIEPVNAPVKATSLKEKAASLTPSGDIVVKADGLEIRGESAMLVF